MKSVYSGVLLGAVEINNSKSHKKAIRLLNTMIKETANEEAVGLRRI